MTRYELTISPDYVPDWGVVEAFRELYQNARDNEIENPENTMSIEYLHGVLRVSNKTSKLEAKSLLLGSTTKRDDPRTVGEHGEGYKLAFMVLLRLGKKVRVENYGAKELWNVKLVNSRKFDSQIVVVEATKGFIWEHVPNNDLSIIVEGITEDEWKSIKERVLALKKLENVLELGNGRAILLDEAEKGNIYVSGLFVQNVKNVKYGYEFPAEAVSLDRDRKLISTFNIQYESSRNWYRAMKKYRGTDRETDIAERVQEMITSNCEDCEYIGTLSSGDEVMKENLVAGYMDSNGYSEDKNYALCETLEEADNIRRETNYKPIVAQTYKLREVVSLSKNVVAYSKAMMNPTCKASEADVLLFGLQKLIDDADEHNFTDEELDLLEEVKGYIKCKAKEE